MSRTLIAIALATVSFHCLAGDLPDRRLTPGAINPDVTQSDIDQTICVRGWTKTIRPPAYYTNGLKKQEIAEYGYVDTNPKHYEEDHLIPLEVGGNPTDVRNLWPEPWHSEWSAHRKDELENQLHRMVCDREISLSEAQRAIATNWIEAYKKYVVR
jgi:hypothetical protein